MTTDVIHNTNCGTARPLTNTVQWWQLHAEALLSEGSSCSVDANSWATKHILFHFSHRGQRSLPGKSHVPYHCIRISSTALAFYSSYPAFLLYVTTVRVLSGRARPLFPSTRALKHSHSTVAFLFIAILTFHLSLICVKEGGHSHVWINPMDSVLIWVQTGITDIALEKRTLSPLPGSLSTAEWPHRPLNRGSSGSAWATHCTEHRKIPTIWERKALFPLGRGVSRMAQEWETSVKRTISPLWLLFFFLKIFFPKLKKI